MALEVKPVSIRSKMAGTLIAELETELRQSYPPHYIHELNSSSFESTGSEFLVCMLDGTPIGCLGLRPLDSETAELKRMFVRPEHRGCGAAKMMLQEIEKRATANGFKKIVLETGNQQTAAIQLYLSKGYKPVPPYNPSVEGPASACFNKNLNP